MYSDKKKHTLPVALAAVIAAAAIILMLFSIFRPDQEVASQGTENIRYAVLRCARQCFAVEGVYPPSLAYLEENYGLTVNHKNYYIVYSAFASNLPPSVRVVER